MAWLDDEDIDVLYKTAIDAGLDAKRDALFAGLPPLYFRSFPRAGSGVAQIFIDLGRVNAATPMADGRIPLRHWLRRAFAMTEGKPAAEVFLRYIIRLDRQLAAPSGEEAAELAGALAPWKEEELRGLVEQRLSTQAASLGAGAKDALNLVTAAVRDNWMEPLLVAALAQRPEDATLLRLAEARGLRSRTDG